MDWDDFRYFSELARTESVRAAAAQLGVNASTVTRRLDQLEERLGVRLFTRSRTGLNITSEGAQVVAQLEQVSADIGEIERRLRGRDADMEGQVRITMPDVFAVNLLMDVFSEFVREYPRIRLEFLPAYRNLDLEKREADVAIRVTGRPPDSLVGKRLGQYRMAAYASRRYLESHDPFAEPGESVWIESGLEAVRSGGFKSRYFPDVPVGTRCNNLILQLI